MIGHIHKFTHGNGFICLPVAITSGSGSESETKHKMNKHYERWTFSEIFTSNGVCLMVY